MLSFGNPILPSQCPAKAEIVWLRPQPEAIETVVRESLISEQASKRGAEYKVFPRSKPTVAS